MKATILKIKLSFDRLIKLWYNNLTILNTNNKQMNDLLGKQWIWKGKAKTLYTVINILTTTNIAGNIVKTEILNRYEFMGITSEYISPVSSVIRWLIK